MSTESIEHIKDVSLYPDTGHHYVSLSVRPDIELPDHLIQACYEDREPWKEHSQCSYVRWRLGFKQHKSGEQEPVIWCAVETNTGDHTRGSTLDTIPEVQTAPEGRIPPYFSNDARNREAVRLVFQQEGGESSFFQELLIKWPQELGKPYDVDLVVDFGNSRTTAVLIETPRAMDTGIGDKLSEHLKPVLFTPRLGESEPVTYNASEYTEHMVAESWFVLQQPTFAAFEPPHLQNKDAMMEKVSEAVETRDWKGSVKKEYKVTKRRYRVPQVFVELSPAVMGQEAALRLSTFRFEYDGMVFLSSPKRYAWDHSPRNNPFWVMVPNNWDRKEGEENAKLAAQVLRFMRAKSSPDEALVEDWPLTSPPILHSEATKRAWANPNEPNFCRADAIVWAALNVMETARRQYSSVISHKGHAPNAQRNLRSVTVTFPPGWTNPDKALYQRKWQTALNIFSLSHLRDPLDDTTRPVLHMDVDEAFASQFPIVYGEIMRMGGIGENWIELVGRGEGTAAVVRVLSIDIGGGTTDYSIIEYRDSMEGHGVELHPALLFKDSSSVAGDTLVKSVIENVLLPGLYRGMEATNRRAFEALFNGPKNGSVNKEKWKRIVRRMLIPKAIQMLSHLVTHPGAPVVHNNTSDGAPLWESGPLNDLNAFAKDAQFDARFASDSPVVYAVEDLHECVRQTFRNLLDSLAKFVSIFQVDLVVASGKPTELPEVRALLERSLPLLPNRIIHAKGYPIGTWYPFRDSENRIFDAKTVAVAGAALYRLIIAGKVDGWHIRMEHGRIFGRESTWVRQVETKLGQSVYLKRGVAENEIAIQAGTRIGRRILESQMPEPVYILEWANSQISSREAIKVKLRRTGIRPGVRGEEAKDTQMAAFEALELVEAKGKVKNIQGEEVNISKDDLRLSRCTLDAPNYWMDDPSFHIAIPDGGSETA